ncbi:MAG: SpoIIE family protein phosphatase [Clostridiales bacterium]|nr:SpoIIE family protein phosphatase [Candidatus Coliplasma equi]
MKDGKAKLESFGQELIRDPLAEREIFKENEYQANMLIAKTMLAAAGVILICWILNAFGVLEVGRQYAIPTFLGGSTAFIIPAVITHIYKGERGWIKYMLLVSVTLVLAYMSAILSYNTPLLIIFPVVFSCRYYSGAITAKTAVLSFFVFAASAWLGAYTSFDSPDMNFAADTLHEYVRNVMLLSFMPRLLTAAVISVFCFGVARYGRKMVLEQDEVSRKTARINTELEMAGQIQSQALPKVESLSENAVRRFDIAAEMIPAKEVGGDFYDFFYPDESHIALIIADVADKGVAASLYMMMAKTLLSSRIGSTLSPAKVLESVNRYLYKNSPKGMFVTAWLGILDLKTGVLSAASAGHEYPVIRRGGKDFELIKDKHGFVLGGMDGMKFPEYVLELAEGDTLFVYTDGVPEANDENGKMFGTERMVESLNRHKDKNMAELIGGVREDIRGFTVIAAQFDDITMLAFQLRGKNESEITVNPTLGELYRVQEYVHGEIGGSTLSAQQHKKIDNIIDEIFSNIVKYGQATKVGICCKDFGSGVRIVFRDDGIPFDPLKINKGGAPTPKVTGGMGIYITEKIADGVEYAYTDGRNTLTIVMNKKENEQ